MAIIETKMAKLFVNNRVCLNFMMVFDFYEERMLPSGAKELKLKGVHSF